MINKNELKKQLDIVGYKFSLQKATRELGLENDLILELIEEFILQIQSAKNIFLKYINELTENKKKNISLDYTKLRDLAHKNLGVARNLRIDDSQIVLNEIMTKDNLEYLKVCVYLLEDINTNLKNYLSLAD